MSSCTSGAHTQWQRCKRDQRYLLPICPPAIIELPHSSCRASHLLDYFHSTVRRRFVVFNLDDVGAFQVEPFELHDVPHRIYVLSIRLYRSFCLRIQGSNQFYEARSQRVLAIA